jgi:murein DD-endopeptidase MepM/ murein hydrolase activator NlpD
VVSVRDGLPEQAPNAAIVGVERPLDFGGNQVVVRIGPGVYAHYNHLQPRSLDVRKGEHVKAGQLIGKLGNSGNSTGPHLHFGLNTGPESLTSNSLSFVFDHYTWAGSVDPEKSTLPNLHIEGTPRTERKSYPVTYSRAQDERAFFKIRQTYAHFRRHDAAWVLIYNHMRI